ncbi:MAG: hypothetical protein NT093_01970 [Candidatus Moranbacteria bacterium]|nr:hypothetical protein [Candidatus Moranbacteria bacterium]
MKRKEILSKSIQLRKRGRSFREISELLNISKSTASLWTRAIILNPKAIERLTGLRDLGRKRSKKTKERQRMKIEEEIAKKARMTVRNAKLNDSHRKIICSLIYWCEGGKNDGGRVNFTNSDPQLMRYFLKIFRKSFPLNEKKFRALLHMHEYHQERKQIRFWSKVTKIPTMQFSKSFHKKNSGKNIRAGYPGCLSVRYYDSKIQKELVFISKEIFGR